MNHRRSQGGGGARGPGPLDYDSNDSYMIQMIHNNNDAKECTPMIQTPPNQNTTNSKNHDNIA